MCPPLIAVLRSPLVPLLCSLCNSGLHAEQLALVYLLVLYALILASLISSCTHHPALFSLCNAGLHSEQLALVDLLVLSRSAKLVGTRDSSFSLLARELRLLQYGLGRRSVQLRLGAIKKLPAKLRDPYGFDPFMALMPEKPPAATAAAAAAG